MSPEADPGRAPAPTMPRLARLLITLAASADVREAVLGDFAEELARRHGADPLRARLWLWGQVVASTLPWAVYRTSRAAGRARQACVRSARTSAARDLLAVTVGLGGVTAAFLALNTPWVLEAVRSLPLDVRLPTARLLNVGALVLGGFLAGAVSWRRPGALVAALAAVELAPVAASWLSAGGVGGPVGPLWALVVVGSLAAGVHLAHPGLRGRPS